MPEYPDICLYIDRIAERVVGHRLVRCGIYSPFVLRSFLVDPSAFAEKSVVSVSRLGKRIVFELEGDYFIVIHLMIAGRFQWKDGDIELVRPKSRDILCTLKFETGALTLTEMSTKKRAGIWFLQGRDALRAHNRGGINVLDSSLGDFIKRIREENRTLKRALTDPNKFDGIGNAYSDEILFHSRLSPLKLTLRLSDEEVERLYQSARETLADWRAKLLLEFKGFPLPKNITAFRPDFATHGKFGKPCPDCGAPIQRIVYSENETNYCAGCQNGGKILADRSLSKLLKDEFPSNLEELLEGFKSK